jgi:hypothetical protein
MVRQRYEFPKYLGFKRISLKRSNGLTSMIYSPDMSLKEQLFTVDSKKAHPDKIKNN